MLLLINTWGGVLPLFYAVSVIDTAQTSKVGAACNPAPINNPPPQQTHTLLPVPTSPLK